MKCFSNAFQYDLMSIMGFYKSLITVEDYFIAVLHCYSCHVYIICRLQDDNELNAFDDESASIIKLNNTTVLYLREVNRYLALVCILREDNFIKQGKTEVCFFELATTSQCKQITKNI